MNSIIIGYAIHTMIVLGCMNKNKNIINRKKTLSLSDKDDDIYTKKTILI